MFLKKIISRLIFPLPLGIELLAAGLILWSFTRFKRTGRGLVLAGTLWIGFIGYPWLSRAVLPGFTLQYPPLSATRLAEFAPKFIVVPGMGISPDARYPANLRTPTELLQRLVEAVRVHRLSPGSRILVSISNPESTAEEKTQAVAELMTIFGVDPANVTVMTGRYDTEEEIQGFLELAGNAPVCLVSSAVNLPRAMTLARRHGLNAIASPSSPGGFPRDPQLPTSFNIVQVFPNAESLGASELAVYEGLGLAFVQLKRFFEK
jgi:uncharacterized SAM-binding protein YcdF (DUF218 family)